MIDPILFRCRIGIYNHGRGVVAGCGSGDTPKGLHSYNETLLHLYFDLNGKVPSAGNVLNKSLNNILCVLILMIYTYMLCILMALVFKTSLYHVTSHTVSETFTIVGTFDRRVNLYNCFFIIILNTIKLLSKDVPFSSKISIIKACFGLGGKMYSYIPLPPVLANKYTFWIALMNLTLIVICNPTITNPGPGHQMTKLSVLYHNIRGFVSPNELGEADPMLNVDKLFEFQSYIYDKNLI